MGWRYEVDGWCVVDEYFAWDELYKGSSLRQALKAARRFKKETGDAVRLIWR